MPGRPFRSRPEFALWDGDTRIIPSRVGFIYRIERAEGDRLLISLPSQGLLGWVPRDSVVEYNQAESFFTTELDLGRNTSFAHLMRAIVCQDNARLDRSFADLDEAIRGPSERRRLDRAGVPLAVEESDGSRDGRRQQGDPGRPSSRARPMWNEVCSTIA